MIRISLAFAAALALVGCATDRVTLLENEPGSSLGAIAVLSPDGDDTVLNQPNQQARLSNRSPRVRTLDQLDPSYAPLMETLPPAPVSIQIDFGTGESEIEGVEQQKIDEILAIYNGLPGAQIEVAGFTDSIGEATVNDRLSRERAESVANELRRLGVPIDPGDEVGRGEDEAVAALGDEVSNQDYRKVVVIIR